MEFYRRIWKVAGILPLVHRELRVAARDSRLYSRRVRWAVLQVLAACGVMLFSAGGFKRGAAEFFFSTFSILALVLGLLEGIRKTSDSISSEKRGGTLGLLFLSTLSGADVVLGKFMGASIRSLSVLLPILPVLAISLLVGGTTLGEFARVALVLGTTAITALAVCLLISALSREKAVFAAFIAIGSLCLLPLLASWTTRFSILGNASPFILLRGALEAVYRTDPRAFWSGLAILWFLTLSSLTTASLLVPRLWQDRPELKHHPPARVVARAKRRRLLLAENPVLWLNFDAAGGSVFRGVAILLLICGLAPLIALTVNVGNSALWSAFPAMAAGVLAVALWMRAAIQCATMTAEAKQNGSLELLLSTPLSVEEVIEGFWLALWKGIRVPVYCLMVLLVVAVIVASLRSVGQVIWSSKTIIELVLQIAVLTAVGLWMGLRAKNRASAVVYTILLGGVLPWLICIFTILVQIVLLLRALEQTKRILRRVRNGGALDVEPLRIPGRVRNLAPPVIR